MLIRAIETSDDAAVYDLIRSSLKAVGLDIPGTAYFDPQLAHLTQFYANRDDVGYWVADEKGAVVGGVGIGSVAGAPDVCELQKLYVDGRYRGSGYGSRLLDAALAFAAQHYRQCYLETHTKLKTARALYARHGFVFMDHPLPGGEHSAMDCWAIRNLKDLNNQTLG